MTAQKKRTYEIIAGICFLLATVSYSIGSEIVEAALAAITDGTVQASFTRGMLLELLNCAAVITIGAVLYLRLEQQLQSIAFGYLLSRTAEAILLAVGSFAGFLHPAGALALHGQLLNTGLLVLGIYSTVFCAVLVKRSIGPRWLMIVGTVGYIALAVYAAIGLLGTYGYDPMWLFAPGAVFEVVFPVWLILKGFPKQAA